MSTSGTPLSSQVIAAVERVNMAGWNRAMASAFRRGATDFLLNVRYHDCPYSDRRKLDGRLTWSRAFRVAWRDGWCLAHKTVTGADPDLSAQD